MHPLMEPEAEIRDGHTKFFFDGSAVSLACPSMSAPCDFGYGRRQLSSCLSEGKVQASFYRAPECPPHPIYDGPARKIRSLDVSRFALQFQI